MIQAAKEGKVETVVKLLNQGIEIDCRGAGQYTALIASAKAGQVKMVEFLCSRRADVNAKTEFGEPEDGYTALLWAIVNQDPVMVEALLANGADANIADGWGNTPLMLAATKNNLAFVKSLITHGADASHRREADGRSALFDAMSEENLPMVDFMVSHGADPMIKDAFSANLLMIAADAPSFLEGVKYCVDKGIGINDRDKYGTTAIHYAVRGHSDEGSATLTFLIEKGGDVSAKDGLGKTPLMEAAHAGAQRAINILIDAGARVNDRDDSGSTPLHYAAWARGTESKDDSVRLLLSRGAEIEARDKEGLTPLLVASEHDRVLSLGELIRHKANINAQDNDGWTGLMYAARRNNLEALKVLLENGADLDIKSKSGKTALMIAEESAQTRGACDLLRSFVKK